MISSFSKKDIFTKSNCISFLRIFLAIPLWFLLERLGESKYRAMALAVCLLAYLTDITDGYLARKFGEVTELGKIIDPFADKVVVSAIVIKLFLLGLIPCYYFFLVIGRDILIFVGGILLSKKIGRVLPSNYLGKITVIFIGLVIVLTLVQANVNGFAYIFFYYSSIVLIFASLIAYFIRGMEFFKRNNESI
jgi:CDP-diacylglycerol--glycerol-3-phosphate 3-phosphatidyltransferase